VKNRLVEVLPLVWETISEEFFEKLWKSMPDRVAAVLEAKGGGVYKVLATIHNFNFYFHHLIYIHSWLIVDIPLSIASCQLPVACCPLLVRAHTRCLKAPATPLLEHPTTPCLPMVQPQLNMSRITNTSD